jgi:hypothetical protein
MQEITQRMVFETRLRQLHARIRELEAALAHQRQLTEAERSRANALEEAARRAWQAAIVPRRVTSGNREKPGYI